MGKKLALTTAEKASARSRGSNVASPPPKKPEEPKTDFVVHLSDFSALEDHDFLDCETVRQLFGDEITEANYIQRFCENIQELVQNAPAENILMMNDDDLSDEEADNEDASKKIYLFKTLGSKHWVQGYVGVLKFTFSPKDETDSKKTLTLNIRSRFDQGPQSFFLLHLFEHAMGSKGKIFHDMDLSAPSVDVWDLLLATAFVRQLHHAMKKGMLRQYRDYERNDARINGRIDMNRHVRQNVPFTGRVAYTAREYVVDNPINILILRALDRLECRHRSLMRRLIAQYPVVQQGVTLLRNEIPDWKVGSDASVLLNSKRKVANSVYREYEPLRKTAIAVLNRMGTNPFAPYSPDANDAASYTVSGFLISMPKLWEEFLYNTIIQSKGNSHYQQRAYPIIGGNRQAEPDFLMLDKCIVLDAKYKNNWGYTVQDTWTYVRDDTYQVISYALIFNCIYCGIIFPISEKDLREKSVDDIRTPVPIQAHWCQDRYFLRIPYVIPEFSGNETAYLDAFKEQDEQLTSLLQTLAQQARKIRSESSTDDL